MKTDLTVQGRTVKGYVYHRLNIPAKISKELNIKVGDKITVDIIGVVESSEEDSKNEIQS